MCCKCCKKQGLQHIDCEIVQLEFERRMSGKELSEDERKGMLLEKAVSNALTKLEIPHKHNPFNNTYPCYQKEHPDVIIPELNTLIECKNLNENQVYHLTRKWLDENIIERPHVNPYKRKIALFSYKPRPLLVQHLNMYGWKVYSLGTQILTFKQGRKAIGNLIKKCYWLKKGYTQTLQPKQTIPPKLV